MDPQETPARPSHQKISIVVPVLNEAGAVESLAREIADAFSGRDHEIIFVDDASADDTAARLGALQGELGQLRVIRHRRNAGQSRAIRTAVLAARGEVIVTLDGDGQNDPADAPRLVDILMAAPAKVAMVGGERRQRRDSASKRWASYWANGIRMRLLNDGAADTGCGLKVFSRSAFLELPYFDHMHRYLPALFLRDDHGIVFEEVNHRSRTTGTSKYNNINRLASAIFDLAGVLWLRARARKPGEVVETPYS